MVFRNREENKDLSGIYKITEIESGKVYVGQTKMQFKKRFWHHLANGTSQAKISREMGVGNSTISRIKNNKIYESVK